jgi:hypothetical protein
LNEASGVYDNQVKILNEKQGTFVPVQGMPPQAPEE